MTITWHGETCFLISEEGTRLVINPPKKTARAHAPKGKADIVVFSREPDHSDWERLVQKDSTTVITTPGEYDVRGFFIMVVPTHAAAGNTSSDEHDNILLISHNNRRLCLISEKAGGEIHDEDLERIGMVDVLMVPANAHMVKMTNQIEPARVIPTYTNGTAGKEELQAFLKEFGAGKAKAEPRLSIKKKEAFSHENIDVVLLSAHTS